MKRILMLGLLLLLAPGCVRSLHPFVAESQQFYDPSINGSWTNAEKEISVVITGDTEQKHYVVTYTDEKGKKGNFEVHLAKVQNQIIADIAPAEVKIDASDVYMAHLLPVHSFLLVTYDAQTIRFRTFKDDWFKDYIKQNPDAIKNEKLDPKGDTVLLIAPTEQLQAFVLKHLATKDAYTEASELRRGSPTPKP